MKCDKKFQPCPLDEDDEMFANGIFVFNITKLVAFVSANADKFLLEEIVVKEGDYSSNILTESTVETANLRFHNLGGN